MDPDANLEEQLRLAKRMQDREDSSGDAGLSDADRNAQLEDGEALAELVLALDEWIRKKGFVPLAWAR